MQREGARTIKRGGFAEAAARKLWAEHERIDPEPYRAYVERFHDSAVVGAEWAGLVSELLGA